MAFWYIYVLNIFKEKLSDVISPWCEFNKTFTVEDVCTSKYTNFPLIDMYFCVVVYYEDWKVKRKCHVPILFLYQNFALRANQWLWCMFTSLGFAVSLLDFLCCIHLNSHLHCSLITDCFSVHFIFFIFIFFVAVNFVNCFCNRLTQ